MIDYTDHLRDKFFHEGSLPVSQWEDPDNNETPDEADQRVWESYDRRPRL